MMRIFFIFIILIHGLIHLMGFVKAFHPAEVPQLEQSISKPAGIFWLIAAILFILTAILFLIDKKWWWMTGMISIIISQMLLIIFWGDAKYGTIANMIILIPVVIAMAGSLPGSYPNLFRSEIEKGLNQYQKQEVLTMEDLKHLPSPVQKYIIYSGAVGKEKVQNFRAVFHGRIAPKPDGRLMDFRSVQYNFFDEPTRAFYIKSKINGIPFDGLHLYTGAKAGMQIQVAGLFQVVDAKGPEMNQSETVTMFNDMCLLAPATLTNKNIEWEMQDSLQVKAKYTNQGITISSILYFNEKGELINFSSDDRYESGDGKTYTNYKWTTPVRDYKEFNGRKVISYGEAIWHKPEGDFCYGKFRLVKIDYNCKKYFVNSKKED